MEYWALINDFKVGPLEPEKLISYGITPDTLVWCEGMPQWTPARYVADMQPVIAAAPPAYAPGQPQAQWGVATPQKPSEPCPPSYLVWSVIATVVCCMIPGIVAIIYGIQVDSSYNAGNLQGARDASSKARIWMIVTYALGAIGVLFYAFFAIIGAFLG